MMVAGMKMIGIGGGFYILIKIYFYIAELLW